MENGMATGLEKWTGIYEPSMAIPILKLDQAIQMNFVELEPDVGVLYSSKFLDGLIQLVIWISGTVRR